MIYLDNSATTRVCAEAIKASAYYMGEEFFNPAAAYSPAVAAERAVNGARQRFAKAINASPEEIIFTSGGTESNNMAIMSALKAMRGTGRVIVGATEHPSVYKTAYGLGGDYDIREAPTDAYGSIDIDKLSALITPETKLVSVMQVNNECGAINDIQEIYRRLKKLAPNALLHVDGVQGFIKTPFDARFCDMYSVSGHKFHGPKGVGALYVRKGTRFLGGQTGGGQENGMRSGTLNTPGIMGMDAAMTWYLENKEAFITNVRACKLRIAELLTAIPDVYINGPAQDVGAPHILNVSVMGVRGEVLLHALEEKGVYVSTGSACSAHKKGKNRTLTAMGLSGDRQESAIRISLCPFNTIQEMDNAAAALKDAATLLRRYRRR